MYGFKLKNKKEKQSVDQSIKSCYSVLGQQATEYKVSIFKKALIIKVDRI